MPENKRRFECGQEFDEYVSADRGPRPDKCSAALQGHGLDSSNTGRNVQRPPDQIGVIRSGRDGGLTPTEELGPAGNRQL